MTNKQNCPLCDREADFSDCDNGARKKFYCPTCKVFVITAAAERKLSTIMASHRAKLSALSASLSDEYLLHIFVPPIGTKIPLESVREPRSNWPK